MASGDTEMTSVGCDLKTDFQAENSSVAENAGSRSGCRRKGTNRVQGRSVHVPRAVKD